MFRESNNLYSVLFYGLVLFIYTIFVSNHQLVNLYKSWQSINWIEVSATVNSFVEYKTLPEIKDSPVEYMISYEYLYQGESYKNSTISYFYDYKDSSGRWIIVRKALEEAHRTNLPIKAFVNPLSPSESIVDKYFSYPKATGLLLMLLSLYLLALIMIGVWFNRFITNWRRKKWELKFPNEPWRWRKSWLKSTIPPLESKGFKLLLVGTILLTSLLSAPLLAASNELPSLYEIIYGIVLAIIGIVVSMLIYFRKIKYGYPQLELTPHPFFTGQTNYGRVLVKGGNLHESDITVKLTCRTANFGRHGVKVKVSFDELWSKITKANLNFNNKSPYIIDFHFTIPKSLPDSYNNMSNEIIQWILEVYTDSPGLDLRNRYEVPVFNLSYKKE